MPEKISTNPKGVQEMTFERLKRGNKRNRKVLRIYCNKKGEEKGKRKMPTPQDSHVIARAPRPTESLN